MQEIKPLTSMRGIFALWVFGYHLVRLAPTSLPDPFGAFGRGYLGVDFFFLLSGFILAAVYGQRFAQDAKSSDYLAFLICRFGRMFPLHIAVLVPCVLVAWLVGHPYSPVQVAEETALIQRWPFVHGIFQSINGPSWSISTEWLANILFPVFAAVFVAAPTWISVLAAAVSVLVVGALASHHGGSLDLSLANTWAPVLRCFAEFGLGMSIYRWRRLVPSSDVSGAALLALLGLVIMLRLPDLVVVAVMVPIIATLASNQAGLQKGLSGTWFHTLGELSYSIYLVHLPILTAIASLVSRTDLSPFAKLGIFVGSGLGLTFAISVMTHRWIEVPARDYSKAHARRFRTPLNLLFTGR